MESAYWNDWYSAWGWFFWLGLLFLLLASVGNWGYTYRAHRRFGSLPRNGASDVLDIRYAKGEITRDEYARQSSQIKQQKPTS